MPPDPPAAATPATHLIRAFAWNLGRVVPSRAEAAALAAAGIDHPAARRYAAWRRSLLLVSAAATLAAFALAVADTVDGGLGEYTRLGVSLELAWLAAAGLLPTAALVGAVRWTRPGAAAGPLLAAWAAAFLIPFVYALLPAGWLYRVQTTAPAAVGATDAAWEELAVEFVLAGGGYLLLLPAVLSLIPGAVNGCLRVKALVPAAQLPGWLLVCAAPAFLLFWLVILVVVNHAARSPLLVAGVLLWAGSPALYSVFGRVFVRPQLTAGDVARIGRVKRAVGLTALLGVGLLAGFAATAKVAGLRVVGFDRAAAVSTKMDALGEDDEAGLDEVRAALAGSKSLLYAFDLSSFRLVVDFLAKLLVATAVFADLVLRATLAAWRTDRGRAAGDDAAGYDDAATALAGSLRRAGPA